MAIPSANSGRLLSWLILVKCTIMTGASFGAQEANSRGLFGAIIANISTYLELVLFFVLVVCMCDCSTYFLNFERYEPLKNQTCFSQELPKNSLP